MSIQKYAIQGFNKEHMAKAMGRALPISTKHAVEICSFIRGKSLQRAKILLNEVIDLKRAVPFKRYHHSIAHKTEVGVGRYPVKACQEVLNIVESAESNAQFKGLNTSNLVVSHVCAHKAAMQWHYGRQRRRVMKRTHIEIVLEEKASEKKPSQKEKESKKSKSEEHKK